MTELTDSPIDQRYIKIQEERYEQTLGALVKRVQDLAEEIGREGRARVGHVDSDGKVDYLYAAERVIHTLHWGLANIHVEGLLSAAADAHSAVRGRIK